MFGDNMLGKLAGAVPFLFLEGRKGGCLLSGVAAEDVVVSEGERSYRIFSNAENLQPSKPTDYQREQQIQQTRSASRNQ
jgi:hypothetical protein